MENLGRLLFEEPLAIYAVLVVAEVVLALIWFTRRTRKWALALLAGPVLGLAVGLTAYFVQTDMEQINSAMADIGRSVEAGHLNAAVKYLDPACYAPASGGKTLAKGELIKMGRLALRRWPVKRFHTVGPDTRITGDKATTQVKTRIILQSNEYLDAEWRLEWAERKAGWRIVRIEALYPPDLASWNF